MLVPVGAPAELGKASLLQKDWWHYPGLPCHGRGKATSMTLLLSFTAFSASSELAGPSTTSQAASAPSAGFPVLQESSHSSSPAPT